MASERVTSLASVGLAAQATAPALLHAIRGGLHDVTMLVALLEPTGSRAPDAPATQRFRTIGAQIELLERRIALLAAMLKRPEHDAHAVCACAAALPDVLRLLQAEAVRHRVRLEHDIDGLPPHVRCAERALQQALLACGAWTAQHAQQRTTLRLTGSEERGEAVFDFEAGGVDGDTADPATRDELALLAALVEAAGGRLATTPRLRVSFARADVP